jgi:hypothetical protein
MDDGSRDASPPCTLSIARSETVPAIVPRTPIEGSHPSRPSNGTETVIRVEAEYIVPAVGIRGFPRQERDLLYRVKSRAAGLNIRRLEPVISALLRDSYQCSAYRPRSVFARSARLCIDIDAGVGEPLRSTARDDPNWYFSVAIVRERRCFHSSERARKPLRPLLKPSGGGWRAAPKHSRLGERRSSARVRLARDAAVGY